MVVGCGEVLNPQECFTPDEMKKYNSDKNSDKTVVIRSEKEVINTKPGKGTTTWKFKIQNTRDVAWDASKTFILDAARINLPNGKTSLAMSAYPVESAK